MELMKYVKEYKNLKIKMETSGLMYGLCDSRTIKYSQELDLLLNQVMKFRYPGLKQFESINVLSGGLEGKTNNTIPKRTSRKPGGNSCLYLQLTVTS
jgi:hypothetical protein